MTITRNDADKYISEDGTTVTIPEGVTEIASGTFSGRSKIEKVILPQSLKKIGTNAFASCNHLKSINLHYVEEMKSSLPLAAPIEEVDLTNCNNINIYFNMMASGSYKINEEAKVVYCSTKDNRAYLPVHAEKIHIPANTDNILNAGAYFVDLKEADIDKDNKSYTYKDGRIIKKDGTDINSSNSLKITAEEFNNSGEDDYKDVEYLVITGNLKSLSKRNFKNLKSITLPEGLETIEDGALKYSQIDEINLPSTLKKIGAKVFAGCNRLRKIKLNEGLEEIGNECFRGSELVGEIVIPSTLKIIRMGVFCGTAINKITFNEGLETIEAGAFDRCNNLSEVTFPSTLRLICNEAFNNVPLKKITFKNGIKEIRYKAFKGSSITELVLPESIEVIGDEAFSECKVKKLVIPSSVKSIGRAAFSQAEIEELEIQNGLKIIGEKSFECTNIKKLILPESITKIGNDAFYKCTKLEELVLNEGLEEIGDDAFASCKIKKLITPKSVTKIGSQAFADCKELEEIELNEGLKEIGWSAFSDSKIQKLHLPSTVKDLNIYSLQLRLNDYNLENIKTISQFRDFSIKDLVLPEGIEEIRSKGFDGCFNLSDNLETVVLPSTLKKIESYCFEHCKNLKSVTINSHDLYISRFAFTYCPSLRSLVIPKGVNFDDNFIVELEALENLVLEDNDTYGVEQNCVYRKKGNALIYALAKDDEVFTVPAFIKKLENNCIRSRILDVKFEDGDKINYIGLNATKNQMRPYAELNRLRERLKAKAAKNRDIKNATCQAVLDSIKEDLKEYCDSGKLNCYIYRDAVFEIISGNNHKVDFYLSIANALKWKDDMESLITQIVTGDIEAEPLKTTIEQSKYRHYIH